MKNFSKKDIIVGASILFTIFIMITFKILNDHFGIYLLIGKINQPVINAMLKVLISIGIVLLFDYKKHKKLKSAISIFICVILIPIFIFSGFFLNDDCYFKFNSPDKSKTLVIEETSILLMGSSQFYVKTGGIFIKSLNDSIFTDDGFRPFSNNEYKLTWNNNSEVKLEYNFGGSSSKYVEKIINVN